MDLPDYLTGFGSRDAVVAASGRGTVLRDALPSDPFEGLFTAHIPEPPHLDGSMTTERAALIVVRAYLGALKAAKMKPAQWGAYGRRDRTPDITKAKAYGVLCKLADLFLEHEIAPAAWAAFRLDCLLHAHNARLAKDGGDEAFKVPPLPVLMSATWLGEPPRRGWYRRDYASRGWRGKVVSTTSRTTLMTLWASLQQDLDRVDHLTVERARALYEQRFPDNLLATLIERASAEGRERQAHYDALAAQGEWLW